MVILSGITPGILKSVSFMTSQRTRNIFVHIWSYVLFFGLSLLTDRKTIKRFLDPLSNKNLMLVFKCHFLLLIKMVVHI